MDYTQNFSGLANDYTIGRPAYSNTLIESLYSQYGFSEESVIADIGSGTGKLAKQLLDRGSFVYCIEPNDDMRKIAIEELGEYKRFRAVDGTAAETKLDEKSVDYITTAQAFHWFDISSFKEECKRVLRNNGSVFLIWNMRDMSSEINQCSFEIYSGYCSDFKGFGGGIQKDDIRIKQFFEDKYEYIEFDNPLFYDKNKFISRSLSGSYSLKNGDENYSEYLDALSDLFEKYSKDNVLTIANKTVAYIGRVD
ncbi:MAG: class I SAM-dependent methyltransferase [Acetatifactor sp.]|nr:class I SAM-dependent methyltransferase [Acetatifactor sp.]